MPIADKGGEGGERRGERVWPHSGDRGVQQVLELHGVSIFGVVLVFKEVTQSRMAQAMFQCLKPE